MNGRDEADAARRDDAQLRAEIARLDAQAAKIRAETNLRLHVLISNLIAETERTQNERFWIPFTIFASVFAAALIAVTTILPRLI
jgi:hypothetical protein